MANAVKEIQDLADLVTKRTNDEDGVAEFLELVLKAKE
jgi:hydroxymethylpyrimidine pyrophosphatase-like HAD family hydrolase